MVDLYISYSFISWISDGSKLWISEICQHKMIERIDDKILRRLFCADPKKMHLFIIPSNYLLGKTSGAAKANRWWGV